MLSCMRTTLSLDDDVARLLFRLRESKKGSLKTLVNQALRLGLRQLTSPQPRRRPYRTKGVSLGRCLVGSIDNVAEVLAIVQSEQYR